MKFRDITINDSELFKGFEYICSDYVFSYLFMYAEQYKLQISYDDRTIFIKSEIKEPTFYVPIGDTLSGINALMNLCRENGIKPIFSKIPSNLLSIFSNLKFKISEDRNSFDYIYRNSELANYKGKEYRKQRNNMSSYLKANAPYYTDDIKSHIDECKAFVQKNFDRAEIINPTSRILDNFECFSLEGGIVFNQNKIQAFCIYEKVSNDTVISHVELTDNSHRGIHAYLINEMSKRINEEYINKEDDMGLSGLRRFKEAYNPCFMIKKYTAYID